MFSSDLFLFFVFFPSVGRDPSAVHLCLIRQSSFFVFKDSDVCFSFCRIVDIDRRLCPRAIFSTSFSRSSSLLPWSILDEMCLDSCHFLLWIFTSPIFPLPVANTFWSHLILPGFLSLAISVSTLSVSRFSWNKYTFDIIDLSLRLWDPLSTWPLFKPCRY